MYPSIEMYGLLQFVHIFEIIGELSTLLSHFSKVKKLKIHLSRFQHFADRTLQNSGDDMQREILNQFDTIVRNNDQ